MKKVKCSFCGKKFPSQLAKFEQAIPSFAGIYTLCPDCYLSFMAIYRGSNVCPKCKQPTLIEYKPAFKRCKNCEHQV